MKRMCAENDRGLAGTAGTVRTPEPFGIGP
jgi:hypothetical protein